GIGFPAVRPRVTQPPGAPERRAGSTMRIRTIGQFGIMALIVSACGSAGGQSPSAARPPNPVNLTVYVNDSHVSVSPDRVGAGPLTFIVTNQASQAESLAISKDGSTLA